MREHLNAIATALGILLMAGAITLSLAGLARIALDVLAS